MNRDAKILTKILAVIRRKFIALNIFINKNEKLKTNKSSFKLIETSERTSKPKENTKKGIKIKAEIDDRKF